MASNCYGEGGAPVFVDPTDAVARSADMVMMLRPCRPLARLLQNKRRRCRRHRCCFFWLTNIIFTCVVSPVSRRRFHAPPMVGVRPGHACKFLQFVVLVDASHRRPFLFCSPAASKLAAVAKRKDVMRDRATAISPTTPSTTGWVYRAV